MFKPFLITIGEIYMRDLNVCKNCRYDMNSYHCLDCKHYDGNGSDLKTFCNYCNNSNCDNCVWSDKHDF